MKKNHSCYRRRYLKHIALVLLFYPLSALGAQGHISIKGQSITIMQAIQLIEKNSDYTFFYNAADLEDKQRKDINCNGPIDEILDEVFKDSGISYIVKNKEVILNVQKTNNTQQKKKRTVTGTIIDAVDDSPIIGANITIKGDKNTGTISDIDGNFSLSFIHTTDSKHAEIIEQAHKVVGVGDPWVLCLVEYNSWRSRAPYLSCTWWFRHNILP